MFIRIPILVPPLRPVPFRSVDDVLAQKDSFPAAFVVVPGYGRAQTDFGIWGISFGPLTAIEAYTPCGRHGGRSPHSTKQLALLVRSP